MIVGQQQQHHLGYILAVAFTCYRSRFNHFSSFGQSVVNARRIQSLSRLDFKRADSLWQQPCDAPAYAASPTMANSRFQYVKKFELSDALLPDTYLIARLDGHRFTKFTADHGFSKPNDERGLLLMAEVRDNTLWTNPRIICHIQQCTAVVLMPQALGVLLLIFIDQAGSLRASVVQQRPAMNMTYTAAAKITVLTHNLEHETKSASHERAILSVGGLGCVCDDLVF